MKAKAEAKAKVRDEFSESAVRNRQSAVHKNRLYFLLKTED